MRCSPPRRPKIQITARNRHGRACPGHPRGPAATGRAIDLMSHTSPANPDWSSRSAALSGRAARLALNGGGNGLVEFHIDEALETVALGEAFREPLAMLIGAAADVGSHARYRERRSGVRGGGGGVRGRRKRRVIQNSLFRSETTRPSRDRTALLGPWIARLGSENRSFLVNRARGRQMLISLVKSAFIFFTTESA